MNTVTLDAALEAFLETPNHNNALILGNVIELYYADGRIDADIYAKYLDTISNYYISTYLG